MTDPINPEYYANASGLQSIDVIEAFVPDKPHRWAALKYIFRAGKKDPAKEAEDLRKAIWWLEREIASIEARAVMADLDNWTLPEPVEYVAPVAPLEKQPIGVTWSEPTGCADDCTHPSHRHDHQEERKPMPQCHCPTGRCDMNVLPPKYVTCRDRAEAIAAAKPWPFPDATV